MTQSFELEDNSFNRESSRRVRGEGEGDGESGESEERSITLTTHPQDKR
jgi:hypothetical protein